MKNKIVKIRLTPEAYDFLTRLTDEINEANAEDERRDPTLKPERISPSWLAQDILVDYLSDFYKFDSESHKILPHGGRREGAGRPKSD